MWPHFPGYLMIIFFHLSCDRILFVVYTFWQALMVCQQCWDINVPVPLKGHWDNYTTLPAKGYQFSIHMVISWLKLYLLKIKSPSNFKKWFYCLNVRVIEVPIVSSGQMCPSKNYYLRVALGQKCPSHFRTFKSKKLVIFGQNLS